VIISAIAARITSVAINVSHSIVSFFSINITQPVTSQKIMLVNVPDLFVGSALSTNLRINRIN